MVAALQLTSRNQRASQVVTKILFYNFKIVFMESRRRLHCGCNTCQTQSMAAIPTFTGDGGPILSLTGEQHTEFVLFCWTTLVAAFLALLSSDCDLPATNNRGRQDTR